MDTKLHCRCSLRVYKMIPDGEEKCFGPGIAQLITLVEQNGSLRAAAMEMGMAYSKAWRMVKTTQQALGFPLLITAIGGKKGGGAIVTPECQDFLRRYMAFELQAREAIDRIFEESFQDM